MFPENKTKILVRDGIIPSLIKESTPVLTGPFLPLAFHFSRQAVPGPAIFCNLLSVGQNQFMALQPIIFTSIRRDRREPAFRSFSKEGAGRTPKPNHSAYANPANNVIETLLIIVKHVETP